jgi:hypothetical protein
LNTHSLLSILSRRNAVTFMPFFLLVVVAVTAGVVQSTATAGGQDDKRPPRQSIEEIKKDFNEDDLKAKDDKPAGKWTYATLLDFSRINDPSLPAYVRSIQLLSGGGEYRGINKIKRVNIANRSSKAIVLVQVRVEVFNLNDREKILLEEALPFANASIPPNDSQVVEIQSLTPPRMLKAITKGGELNGDFGIWIVVQAVRFEDGTFWSEPEPVAYLQLRTDDCCPSAATGV